MRIYADSSFMLRLITGEAGSPETIAEYRRLGSPRLFFLSVHALEVRTAILQRAFFERRTLPSGSRQQISRRRDAAFARLEVLLSRRALVEVDIDLAATLFVAQDLSTKHTERTGARSIDLLHVACAMALKTERFLTNDDRQADLAKAEGLEVSFIR